MERYQIEYRIRLAYCLEKYQRNFWHRTNNVVVFFQAFFGTAIFADVSGTIIYGALVAALTMGAFIADPAGKAAIARHQFGLLSTLLFNMSDMEETELKAEFGRISDGASEIMGTFKTAAENRAAIMQGSYDHVLPLTWFQSTVAWLSGDLPKVPKTKDIHN
jgi:Na+-transporting methylmalonyl-CoA/oxaloacetate decarboxylase beta subunit